jgi:hypothetical protein
MNMDQGKCEQANGSRDGILRQKQTQKRISQKVRRITYR